MHELGFIRLTGEGYGNGASVTYTLGVVPGTASTGHSGIALWS